MRQEAKSDRGGLQLDWPCRSPLLDISVALNAGYLQITEMAFSWNGTL